MGEDEKEVFLDREMRLIKNEEMDEFGRTKFIESIIFVEKCACEREEKEVMRESVRVKERARESGER